MLCNERFFPGGVASKDVLLDGLSLRDSKGAGELDSSKARVVVIPQGPLLLRLFMPKEGRPDFGNWWFTPYAFKRMLDHLGVDGSVVVDQRDQGKSVLHGALVLLSEWYGGSSTQLSLFHAARTKEPMWAFYGEGSAASTEGYAKVRKPMNFSDGNGGYSPVRQIFLPEPWTYRNAFATITDKGLPTDANLANVVLNFPWAKLPFE